MKLYVHNLPPTLPDDPFLNEIFDFARSTGGTAKIGPMLRPGEEITAPSP